MEMTVSPHILPMNAKIAPDFSRWRVPATESIVVSLVEGARARQREKDKRGRIQRCLYRQQESIR